MICTSIEQSTELVRLGLDPKTADCNWNTTFGDWSLCIGKNKLPHAVPAWSLSALLEVIPKECEPDLQKSPISGVYFAHCFANGKPQITDDHGNAVTAAYEMVCWLLEQKILTFSSNEKD